MRNLHNLIADGEITPIEISSSRVVTASPYQWKDPASISPRRWLFGRSLLRGSLSLIIAPGAAGKTALTIGMALSLATGREILGKAVYGKVQRVWLWNLEDSGEELERLIQASAIHWSLSPDDIGDRLYLDSGLDGEGLTIASEGRDGLTLATDLADALIDEIRDRNIDVLIVDPFVSSHRVSENDNGAIDAIAKLWAKIATAANCAILIVHHARKLAGAENTADAARGASALVNAARSVLTLNRMSDDESARFGVDPSNQRRFFRVYDDKNNRAPPAGQSDWYQLISVSLGNGPDGGDGDSLPVVVPWSPPDAFDGVTLDHLRQVQTAIDEGDWRKDSQCGNWAGHAVAPIFGLDTERKADKVRVSQLLNEWIKNGALNVEQRKDENRKPRPFLRVGTWADDPSAPPNPGVAKQVER
jgi:hypothetical protein